MVESLLIYGIVSYRTIIHLPYAPRMYSVVYIGMVQYNSSLSHLCALSKLSIGILVASSCSLALGLAPSHPRRKRRRHHPPPQLKIRIMPSPTLSTSSHGIFPPRNPPSPRPIRLLDRTKLLDSFATNACSARPMSLHCRRPPRLARVGRFSNLATCRSERVWLFIRTNTSIC